MIRRPRLKHSRRMMLLSAVCIPVMAIGIKSAPVIGEAVQAEKQIVTLTIDYADGVQKKFTAIPWKKGTTVLDTLKAAQKHPRGIKFQHRGSGRTAFLYKIDDLENRGGGKKNWIFYVNKKPATRGIGAYSLQAGDNILWKFDLYRKK